jgi:ribosomal protein L29
MRSPDATDVERIEGLLRGMPPETERDAQLEGMIRELRSVSPRASHEVREHLRTLRAPERRRSLGWRPVLVVVPVALAVVGAIVLGGGDNRSSDQAVGGSSTALEALQQTPTDAKAEDAAGSARESLSGTLAAPALSDAARAQEWDVSLELAVRDNRSLSDASAEAIRTTRSLGGFVVSSNVATEGSAGRADLVLRIPQRRVQEAIEQFSALGTITGQQVTVQDRQADLDRLAKRIDTLRVQLAEVRAQLAQGGLSEADRLRLELRRQRLQGELNQQTRQRTGVANEVALSEFSLTIQTRRAAATAGDSRIDGAVGDAIEVLSVAAAVGLFLLIVLAPLAAIAALVLLARRSFRRREEERLLDQPRPTPTS